MAKIKWNNTMGRNMRRYRNGVGVFNSPHGCPLPKTPTSKERNEVVPPLVNDQGVEITDEMMQAIWHGLEADSYPNWKLRKLTPDNPWGT